MTETKYFIIKDFIGYPVDVYSAEYENGCRVGGNAMLPKRLRQRKYFDSLKDILNYRMCSCGKPDCKVNKALREIVLNKLKNKKPMGIETIEFRGKSYPKFQSTGNAARFCMPFAKELLTGGVIYDIGYGQEDWKFPNAIGIDKKDNSEYDAMNLPPLQADGIFSSHLLEHLERPFEALDLWTNKLKPSGVIVLYLPAPTQEYWLPFSVCNPKHLSSFTPEIIRKYFEFSGKYKNIFVSGIDAYDSFLTFAEKI